MTDLLRPSNRFPARRFALQALAAGAAAIALPTLAAQRKDEELPPYGEREDVMRFAEDAAQRQGLDPAWTREALARA
ncbi:MAG: hypothetical protein JSR38_07990, partial [Proteobacteria bacterium]|nr:hypothetical protein [Pseudomonadota bacterium]